MSMTQGGRSWISEFVARAAAGPVRGLPKPEPLYPAVGGVYFIRTGESDSGPVKMGSAAHIDAHLRELQKAHGSPIRLLRHVPAQDDKARAALEDALGVQLSALRMRGPWFKAAVMQHVDAALGRIRTEKA